MLTKDTITLYGAGVISIGFFVAGITNVLDYFIVKVLLFSGFGLLLGFAVVTVFQKVYKKNRLEELPPQDDLINIK
ncbi:MAG: hypothetical protein AAF901_05160 [Bacteroidota bacterium]